MSGFADCFKPPLFLGVAVGVLLSISLPILRALLPKPRSAAADARGTWAELQPFVVVAAFSLLTAILVVAFAGEGFQTWKWYQALLAGYAWDSTLQKVAKQS